MLTLDQLCEGLKQVNHDLISDNMVEYCLHVLDIVNDAHSHTIQNDLKLFSTVARLAERMVRASSDESQCCVVGMSHSVAW